MSGSNVLDRINSVIVMPIIQLVFAAGFFLFLWGIVEFFWSMRQASTEGVSTGKYHMFWGVIGMFVMLSVWGIINIVTSTFGIDSTGGSIPTSGNFNAPQSTFQLNF